MQGIQQYSYTATSYSSEQKKFRSENTNKQRNKLIKIYSKFDDAHRLENTTEKVKKKGKINRKQYKESET